MRSILLVFALVAALVLPSVADASVHSALDWLDLGNVVSKLEDIDYEVILIDGGTTGTVDQGDVLGGVWQVSTIWQTYNDFNTVMTPNPAAGDANFTAFFAIEVASKSSSGGTYSYTFTEPTVSNWSSLVSTYGAPARSDSDSCLLLYDDDSPDSNSWIEVYDGSTTTGITNTINTVEDGTLLWEFGFEETDEFWQATSNTDIIASLMWLTYQAGLNVSYDHTSGGIILLDHDVIPPYSTDYQLEISGSSAGQFTNNWLETHTNLYLNAVPEPASILVWGGLAGAIGLLGMIRRRRAGR